MSKLTFAFPPTFMQVVGGKILLASRTNVAIAHFDRPNMDEKIGILVVHPEKDKIEQVTICPGTVSFLILS